MLTYRGDKFVKGKKFSINETEYRFSKRDEDKLVFESIKDNSKLVLTEEEFNKSERMLVEKINQENKEINNIIGKVLRSKGLARKYEDKLKSLGITIDYNQGQGVRLTGPNGKNLSASTKEVFGPSSPGFNNTHKKEYKYYTNTAKDYEDYVKTYQDKYNELKSMKKDDIIRKYNSLSTEEALKKHKEDLKDVKETMEHYQKQAKDYYDNATERRIGDRRDKKAGHDAAITDTSMSKDEANAKVDYLTYLTKPATDKPYQDYSQNYLAGDNKNYSREDDYSDTFRYFGRNGKPSEPSERIKKYKELKRNVNKAKKDADYSAENSGHYASYKSDDALEAEIQKMRDELEEKIKELRDDNNRHKQGNAEDIKELKAKEKELDDYLKSLGIRESDIIKVKELIKESSNSMFNKTRKDITEDTDYFTKQLDSLYDDVLTLAKEASHSGYTSLGSKLNDILSMLDTVDLSKDMK